MRWPKAKYASAWEPTPRAPAGYPPRSNNLIGYKPTRGWLSARGVVPACRSLDCVSIFAFTAADAKRILEAAAGYDAEDVYSRPRVERGFDSGGRCFYFGIPRKQQLRFFGNEETEQLFDKAVEKMRTLGGTAVEIDFAPFIEAARLLYSGPWVAERFAAIQQFFEHHADQVIEPVREIIASAKRYSAADAYNGLYRLRLLKRQADRV